MNEPETQSRLRSPPAPTVDVVVVGGAFAGAATALLLRRSLPSASILVVEARDAFPSKVGEATVETSGYFLNRVLGLGDYLYREHLPKHGLRYWFTDGGADGAGRRLEEMSEIGPSRPSRLPSFQLDRAKLDEHLLELAAAEGCEVLRPARVLDVEGEHPRMSVVVSDAAGRRTLRTRWVVDASGRMGLLANKLDLRRSVPEHPVSAAWRRWEGVLDLDDRAALGPELARRPEAERSAQRLPTLPCNRRLATNHFCGDGWWCWVIPLADGRTSIGVVWNRERFELPGEGPLVERYERFVRSADGLAELVRDAAPCEGDWQGLRDVPYRAERYMGPGWALVGDAASFLDPYYSPGLDHGSMSAYATATLLGEDLRGELDEGRLASRINEHNDRFTRSYERWLEALYVGKYELFGDAELTVSAFLVETALYHLGIVSPVYADPANLNHPTFGLELPQSRFAHRLMRAFNRRLRRLATVRRRTGIYGRRNAGWRLYVPGFDLGLGFLPPLRRGLRIWLGLELRTLLSRLAPSRSSRPAAAESARPVPARRPAQDTHPH